MVWNVPIRSGADEPVSATWRAWLAMTLVVAVTLGMLAGLHLSLPARGQAAARRQVAAPLASLLRRYGIPVSSQVLVFSKTSLQRLRIDAANPRAIFFNERAAVGWVPGSSLLEIAIFDGTWPGVTFQTVDVARGETMPRRGDRCVQCQRIVHIRRAG